MLQSAADASASTGATLIVCPTSLVGQWADELQERAGCTEASRGAGGGLQLFVFYGGKREELPPVLFSYMVVLTSYGTLASEWAQYTGGGGTSTSRRRGGSSHPGSALFNVVWRRVVLDEAHAIKSHTSQAAGAAFALRAQRRWLLTGTPIQNSVSELFSLLHFLRVPGPAESASGWAQAMAKQGRLAVLQQTLRPLMLRRTKETTDAEGEPILRLPPRRSKLMRIPFSPAEADYYRALHSRSKTQVGGFVVLVGWGQEGRGGMTWVCDSRSSPPRR
jgi:DNA repair protein RAD5